MISQQYSYVKQFSKKTDSRSLLSGKEYDFVFFIR